MSLKITVIFDIVLEEKEIKEPKLELKLHPDTERIKKLSPLLNLDQMMFYKII